MRGSALACNYAEPEMLRTDSCGGVAGGTAEFTRRQQQNAAFTMYGQYYCASHGNSSPKPNALIIPVSTFRVLVRRKWQLTQQEVGSSSVSLGFFFFYLSDSLVCSIGQWVLFRPFHLPRHDEQLLSLPQPPQSGRQLVSTSAFSLE